MLSLTELAAREVASSIPFEAVERVFPPVPEPLQLRIAFYSFPELEEDIRWVWWGPYSNHGAWEVGMALSLNPVHIVNMGYPSETFKQVL